MSRRVVRRSVEVCGLVLATCGLGLAQTTRASVSSGGTQGNATSGDFDSSISADGRFVAFYSEATNLTPADTNGVADIFVRDVGAGTTERASVSTGGVQGDGSCYYYSAISPDGRFVVFSSVATNLVTGDTNGRWDTFVRDRVAGTTERVSIHSSGVEGNGDSFEGSITPDGRYVAFRSGATNLVTGDANGADDIFVRDRLSGTTEIVSVDSSELQVNLASFLPSLSSNGRYVAFETAANNLVPGDIGGWSDIFVRDRVLGTTERVSVDSSRAEADSNSYAASISADGRFVAFESVATNLVAGDTNGTRDVFVRDRPSGTTERVSVDSSGTEGNFGGELASISSDGRCVAFESQASNLVAGDTNGTGDIFVRDRLQATTERVSTDSAGMQVNGRSRYCSISSDGRFVAFQSAATNLVAGDTNGVRDVFVRDRGVPPILAACFGDGSGAACPCANSGVAGHGCENSSSTGGALLSASGSPSLSTDTLVLTATGEKPTALSIVLQGSAFVAPIDYGDGLRCAGAILKRLYTKNAVGGTVIAPQGADPSVSARSATLGDPIPLGATRHYQVYYRDAVPSFCPTPQGGTYNISNALSAVWSP